MAKASINPEQSQSTALAATNQSTALSTDLSGGGYNPDQYDDIDRDVGVPVLGLVNVVGNLAKNFRNQGGNFVLGDTLIGPTVKVIPVEVVKLFRETVRNGLVIKNGSPEDATRKVFSTAQEAAAAGYAVDFDNKFANRVEEAGKIGYLVLAPEGDRSGEFVIPLGTFSAAKAKCSYQRGGFREVWRPIFASAAKLAIAKGIDTKGMNQTQVFNAAQGWTHLWELSAVEKSNEQNAWYEPRIRKGEPLASEIVAKITADFAKNYN